MTDLIKLYQNLYDLTVKEEQLLNEDNYDQLLKLLSEKDKLIDAIDDINKKTYIKAQPDPAVYLEKVKSIMQKTKELEDKNISKLDGELKEVKGNLKNIRKGKQSRKGYQGAGGFKEAKFIDKKS